MDTILTVTDVAVILKVKPITVREMFRNERIRGFKVGKAWRTTEAMLQEDIARLARGEAPDKLPKNNGASNHAPKARKKAARKGEAEGALRAAVKEEAPSTPKESIAAPAKQHTPVLAEVSRPEDGAPQQFLF